MRKSCPDCCRKHLAQAEVLHTEFLLGYESYKWLIVGHLAEAEAEILGHDAGIATAIREERLAFISDSFYELSLLELIERVQDGKA